MSNLVRLPEVVKKTGRSKSSIYNGIKADTFPKPIKIGDRAIAFVESEIDEWIEKQIAKSRMEG